MRSWQILVVQAGFVVEEAMIEMSHLRWNHQTRPNESIVTVGPVSH